MRAEADRQDAGAAYDEPQRAGGERSEGGEAMRTIADARPQAASQRQLQAMASASSRLAPGARLAAIAAASARGAATVLQQAGPGQERPAASVREGGRGPGLPATLKAGIESLSGLSMDGVRVHYDSAEPARLGAHAYAQGREIHLAPGQERHLPHEAWHVVQQAQGRVRPTRQMKGAVALNDEPGLETEATEMGRRALALGGDAPASAPVRPAAAGTPALQCAIAHERRGVKHYEGVAEYVRALDLAVQKAYRYLLHVPTLGAYLKLDGHTELWGESWGEYQLARPPSAMAAQFGYVVETLATIVYLPPAPRGLSIELQGPRNGTRPDVILKDGAEDVAWLDITAHGSADHIWGKAGWAESELYLAELTYPSMDLTHFNPTPDYRDDVDLHEFLRRRGWADIIRKIRKQAWVKLGDKFRAPPKKGIPNIVRDNTFPELVLNKLNAYFNDNLDLNTAASVLKVMNVNPKTHCIYESYSMARGMAYLLQKDPNLPSIEIPEAEGVPRGLMPRDDELIEVLRRLMAAEAANTAALDDLPLAQENEGAIVPFGQEGGEQETAMSLGMDEEEEEGFGELAMAPAQEFSVELTSLRLPAELFVQLNQYLTVNNYAFAFQLSTGSGVRDLVAMPGDGFPTILEQLLADAEEEERLREARRDPRQLARRKQYRLKLGFLPQPGRRRPPRLRTPYERQDALPPPQALSAPATGTQALVPASLPPFLFQFLAPTEPGTGDRDPQIQ